MIFARLPCAMPHAVLGFPRSHKLLHGKIDTFQMHYWTWAKPDPSNQSFLTCIKCKLQTCQQSLQTGQKSKYSSEGLFHSGQWWSKWQAVYPTLQLQRESEILALIASGEHIQEPNKNVIIGSFLSTLFFEFHKFTPGLLYKDSFAGFTRLSQGP